MQITEKIMKNYFYQLLKVDIRCSLELCKIIGKELQKGIYLLHNFTN